jgi:hypothetical protein
MNMMAINKRGGSLDDLPSTRVTEDVSLPSPRPERAPKPPGSKIKTSLFVGVKGNAHIVSICSKHRISQQQFITAAVSAYLRSIGEPTLEEIEAAP